MYKVPSGSDVYLILFGDKDVRIYITFSSEQFLCMTMDVI